MWTEERSNCKSTSACRTSERIAEPRSSRSPRPSGSLRFPGQPGPLVSQFPWSAKRRTVEAINGGEIGDLRPLEPVWLMLRESERDETGHCCLWRKTHYFADIVLARDDHRGDDTAEPR